MSVIEKVAHWQGQAVTAEQELIEAVRAARNPHGYSWREIGEQLGCSKQAAWERFGRHCGES